MERKTVRTGIVGAGFAAGFHYEALMRVRCVDVDVAGVYAIDTDMAEAYSTAAPSPKRRCSKRPWRRSTE